MDERVIATLVGIYRAAFDELVQRLVRAVERGTDTAFLHAQLIDVMQLLSELDAEAQRWIGQHLPEAYRAGQHATLQSLQDAGVVSPRLTASFAGVHRTAVELLADNLAADLSEATALVGRRVQDVFREIALWTTAQMRATGTLARQGARDMRDELISRGLTGFVDGAGRRWRLDSYSEMAVRTAVIEAGNVGRINQSSELGFDLVRMTEHHPTCEICAVYQGRIYSVSGNDKRFPALYETAFSHGFNLVHPRCGHSVSPIVESLTDNFDELMNRSNQPFDVDPRTDRQRRAYEAGQRRKRQMREDRRQWERYRLQLPDETPTFSGFRRMKRANSKRWQELQAAYRESRAA